MRVLLVEDNPNDAELIADRLREFDGHPQVAPTLATALELLRRNAFDVLLLDLCLPDSTGSAGVERIQRAAPSLPIIVLTGSSDPQITMASMRAGAQDYLLKDECTSAVLRKAIAYAIERQRLHERLAASEREMRGRELLARATLDALTSSVAILDGRGRIVCVNRTWEQMAAENGVDARTCGVGADYLDTCRRARGPDAAEASAAAAGIADVAAGRSDHFSLEYPCHSPDEQRWFVMQVTRFEVDGDVRVVVAHEDVTARKRAEALERERAALSDAVAAMDQVIGVVGHELRTPLAGLRAMSEYLITDGALAEQAHDFARRINAETVRMADTVYNLIETARLNSGQATWNWGEFSLRSACESALETVAPLVEHRGVTLTLEADGAVGETMHGDEEAVRRLVVNLLSNAQKHTREGTIRVSLTSPERGWAEVAVSDSGSGIAPHILQRVGRAFELNSGVVGQNYTRGSGLGLAICKAIAAAHGGYLHVESGSGRGTRVTARLRTDLESPSSLNDSGGLLLTRELAPCLTSSS